MNRIKIIKCHDAELAAERQTRAKKPPAVAIGRGAAAMVGRWIDGLRSQKTTDARSAFADLFRSTSPAG